MAHAHGHSGGVCSMWTVAMQMSMDSSMHSAKASGKLSERYMADHRMEELRVHEGGILGASFSDDAASPMNPDGTMKPKPRSLGM